MWINLWFLVFLTVVAAVKEHTFKTCDSAGFCHRNKHFASVVRQSSDYKPHYRVDTSSVSLGTQLEKFSIIGDIVKDLPNGGTVSLPFEISALSGAGIRFTLNEDRSGAKKEVPKLVSPYRYNETAKWAFGPNVHYVSNLKHTIGESNVVIHYDEDQRVELEYFPFKLTFYRAGKVHVVVNDQNLLNVEHWRSRSANENDHLFPEESNFNLFQDTFAGSTGDTLPLGPESIGLDFSFKGYKHLYGIPEHADSLALKDTTGSDPYRLYAVDIFEYETDSRMSMYGAVPFLLGVNPESSVGLFWINSADTFIDIDKSSDKDGSRSHWVSENGILDFIVITGDTPGEINSKYGSITGNTQLPPLFSLGYHQCRWNYNDEKDVLDISSKFDEHEIPYDTIWLDVEYADSKKYFTWQNEKFPDPKRLLGELDRTGRNLVVIVDPHLKTGYKVGNEVIAKKITINDNTNASYHGHCWPGESVWIDTLNPNSQAYWDSKFTWGNYFLGGESANIHLWNDMNEPSVFNGPEDSAPRDNLHYGGWEHRSVHNVYGLTFHEATYNSLIKRTSGNTNRERPFILTRGYFAGSQRSAAMWTGDNMSKWEYLQISIPMVLTSGVSGMPFAGADVGGFFGNPSKELLTRWYQTGIWYPFFRGHAHIDSRRREPWVAGEPYTSAMRDAIRLRYKLLPVLYESFYESSKKGLPILRPLFYESLDNEESYTIDDQFFVGGSGLLVKPVTHEDSSHVAIYLPTTDVYYDYTNGQISDTVYKAGVPQYIKKAVGLNDIPMLLRGGSILPSKERYRRSTRLMKNDPYSLVIALNEQGHASGKLYLDDGESFGYTNSEFILVHFEAIKNSIIGKVLRPNFEYAESLENIEIEKITVLSPQEQQVTNVRITQNQQTWDAKYDSATKKVVIKKPQIKINSDWKIDLDVAKAIEHDEL